MKYIIRGLGMLLIPVIVSGVLFFLRQPKKAERGKVYLPKFFVIFGSAFATLFLIPTLITAFTEEPIWLPILFFALSLVGACFVIAYVNCRISYDKDGFVAKNFFGIKRKFTYDQVTAIKEGMHEDYLYLGRRRVMIDEFAVGGCEFIAFVRKRYRAAHGGLPLPKIERSKHDIFNGNIEDTAGFVTAYVMISAVIVALAGFLLWFIFLNPSTPDDTQALEVTFVSCTVRDDRILMTASDGEPYRISHIDGQIDTERIAAACRGAEAITAYCVRITPDDGADFYSVKALYDGDTCLLSFDETNRLHRQEYWPLLAFPAVFAIVWGAFVAGSIAVGRNPRKYSKRVVKLFFKDGYVK